VALQAVKGLLNRPHLVLFVNKAVGVLFDHT
jgi:hypothetical protein